MRTCGSVDTSPGNAAFVGDSEADLNAAKSAAVRFYGVNAKAEGRDRLTALGASAGILVAGRDGDLSRPAGPWPIDPGEAKRPSVD